MTHGNVVAIGAVLLLSVSSSVAQDQDRDRSVQQLLLTMPVDTVTDAEVFETNGFRIESGQVKELDADLTPNGNTMQSLTVTADAMFKVGIEKGRPMSAGGGLAIYHRQTGTPMLTVGDQDGDGRIDTLEYYVVDADGEPSLSVVDYEADGQLDLRMNFKQSYFEIWHTDRWYRAETREGRRGILMEGEFVELQRENNRWIVP